METGKAELETMVSVLQKLEKDGYSAQFQATENGLMSLTDNKVYNARDVKVESYYRFEGESNPDDNSIVYAISTSDGVKGTLTDSYGRYSDQDVGEFMRQVNEIDKRT